MGYVFRNNFEGIRVSLENFIFVVLKMKNIQGYNIKNIII